MFLRRGVGQIPSATATGAAHGRAIAGMARRRCAQRKVTAPAAVVVAAVAHWRRPLVTVPCSSNNRSSCSRVVCQWSCRQHHSDRVRVAFTASHRRHHCQCRRIAVRKRRRGWRHHLPLTTLLHTLRQNTAMQGKRVDVLRLHGRGGHSGAAVTGRAARLR